MTTKYQQEGYPLPHETYQAIKITYYCKTPPRGTISGSIIASAWVSVKTKYVLNSLFITELAREQIPDFDRLVHPEGFNTPAANERLTRLHLL